jgi:surface polysaccharide O-acyltransferase-like enzyme
MQFPNQEVNVNKQARPEIPYIHLIRVIACFMVICIHTRPNTLGYILDDTNSRFNYFLLLLVKPCVPLFFMITGALILPNKETECLSFYKKRIPKVLYPLLVWGVVYAVLPWLLDLQPANEMLVELLLSPIKAPDMMGGILWYLFMLIGIYLIIPYINPLLYKDIKLQRIYLGLWILSSVIMFFRTYKSTLMGLTMWDHNFDLTIYFSGYLGYVLLGYMLHKSKMLFRGG